jgi:hypothetical protein
VKDHPIVSTEIISEFTINARSRNCVNEGRDTSRTTKNNGENQAKNALKFSVYFYCSRTYVSASFTGSTTLTLKSGDAIILTTKNANANNAKINNVTVPATGSSNTDVYSASTAQYAFVGIAQHDGSYAITCTLGSTPNYLIYPDGAV